MTNTINNEDNIVTTAHPFEGLANGEERLAKAKLAHQINVLIQEQGMKQQEASELLGITQPEVSHTRTVTYLVLLLIDFIVVYMPLIWMLKLF